VKSVADFQNRFQATDRHGISRIRVVFRSLNAHRSALGDLLVNANQMCSREFAFRASWNAFFILPFTSEKQKKAWGFAPSRGWLSKFYDFIAKRHSD
jgi:hypothetical protein